VVAQAEGDAQRFRSVLTEYQKAPQVTRDRMYIDTMQQIYSNVTKVLVDSRSGSNLLYLPLDRLLQQSGAGTPSQPIVVPAPAPTESVGTSSAADIRSRDGARTRDREGR
jgi:membrane protease subunit HflK